jgi:hypothetical protein
VLARDEEPQPTTQESMFNYIRLSDGGPRRHEGPRSEVEVIAELAPHARRTDPAGPAASAAPHSLIDWQSMQDTGKIREAIAKVVPGFEQLATIGETKEEFQLPAGRSTSQVSHARRPRDLHVHDLPELPAAGELRLMTVRSEGQFNTVVYEEEDHLSRPGAAGRDPAASRRHGAAGLAPDQRVTVRSETGTMTGILARPYPEIRAGNALMYYPEANVLVPRTADPAFEDAVV